MKNKNFYFKKKRLRLEINKSGFCLWDEKTNQWVIDASTINHDTKFAIGTKKARTPYYSGESHKWFKAKYSEGDE